MQTPVEVTDRALAQVRADEVDGIVAIGGGSTTGLGKALAYRTDLPQIVVPTTYAGSETTPPSRTHPFHDRRAELRTAHHARLQGGDRYLDSDVVFGVKDSLIRRFEERPAGLTPDGRVVAEPCHHLHSKFALAPARS